MARGRGRRRRARRVVAAVVGSSVCEGGARLHLEALSSVTENAALAESVQQIDKDLPRLAVREETRARIREVLMAWLALNNFVGYAQGMDMMCSALLAVYDRGKIGHAEPGHARLVVGGGENQHGHGSAARWRRLASLSDPASWAEQIWNEVLSVATGACKRRCTRRCLSCKCSCFAPCLRVSATLCKDKTLS